MLMGRVDFVMLKMFRVLNINPRDATLSNLPKFGLRHVRIVKGYFLASVAVSLFGLAKVNVE
jgi:hypothetical protein